MKFHVYCPRFVPVRSGACGVVRVPADRDTGQGSGKWFTGDSSMFNKIGRPGGEMRFYKPYFTDHFALSRQTRRWLTMWPREGVRGS